MQRVLDCLWLDHNLWLVAFAALVCVLGSWITMRLFVRSRGETPARRAGWLFLTGVAAGGSVWCTHFVAMLGYRPSVGAHFDPMLTALSFLIVLLGTMIGFGIAGSRLTRVAPELGGAVVGLSVAAMHYVGMAGYSIEGIILLNPDYVKASVVLAAVLGALAVNRAVRPRTPWCRYGAAGILTLAIVSLHFTGMAGLDVYFHLIDVRGGITDEMIALATAIGGVGLLIVGMGITSHLLDQSMRTESMTKLRRMALHDTLTHLPNRANFTEHLNTSVARAEREGARLAVLAVDLDRFKEINDQFGHDAGDEALTIFSNRVGAALEKGEFLARVGGDEFALVRAVSDDEDLEAFVTRIAGAATARTRIGGIDTMMGASIGVALFPDDAKDADALVKAADLAMYRAKGDPAANVSYYEPSLDNVARRRRTLAANLRRAIDDEALTLHYQVQKDIRGDRTIGYEVLLRWTHPELGSISPAEFIPLAEETGLIVPLGEWVLRRACMDAAQWDGHHKVSVNISAVQFSHADLALMIEDALWKSGLSATRLEIEITESVLMTDMEATIKTLREVQALGVTVAMDDFGTGYSSLANLQAFAFDKIKLDRAFIWKLEQSTDAQAIIRAVLALGRSLDIPVLAEGVETAGQRDFLLNEGCFEVQGFFYGRPVPVDELDGAHPPATPQREAPLLKVV